MATQAAIPNEQKQALIKMVWESIIEAVREAGSQGAPGGHLYAALMAHGFSLEQFQTIMGSLVRVGELEKRGECYFVKGGR